jgi:hypothetical protein
MLDLSVDARVTWGVSVHSHNFGAAEFPKPSIINKIIF